MDDKLQLRLALQSSLHDVLSNETAAAQLSAVPSQQLPFNPVAAAAAQLNLATPAATALSRASLSAIQGSIDPSDPLSQARAATAALLNQQHQQALEERKRQIILEQEKARILQDSYMTLLKQKSAVAQPPLAAAPAASATPNMTLDVLLAAQASAQLQAAPALQTALLTQLQQPQKPTPNALEALGNSLRSKNDPYIDVSTLPDPDPADSTINRTRGGVSTPFPEKLHQMLADAEKEGKSDVVSFFSHGRAFGVHDPERFVSEIMPKYYKQSKWHSFARQLNLYGFIRITSGPDAGGYYHELFLKGRPNLSFYMRRVGVPSGPDRRKSKPKQEAPDPDFYSMKPVTTIPK